MQTHRWTDAHAAKRYCKYTDIHEDWRDTCIDLNTQTQVDGYPHGHTHKDGQRIPIHRNTHI